MSTTIVPLAGPDFYSEEFGIRPLYPIKCMELLDYILSKRSWIKAPSQKRNQLIFVLREQDPYTQIMRTFISKKYPSADVVTISCLSLGAPLSVLSGLGVLQYHDVPVIIDLADILFDTVEEDLENYFEKDETVDGIIPYFQSSDPKYSYVQLDGVCVTEAREKKVISSHASTGVYFFRNTAAYLQSVLYCLQHPDICRVGNSFFVCPSMNGLIKAGRKVQGVPVHNVEPISRLFHET